MTVFASVRVGQMWDVKRGMRGYQPVSAVLGRVPEVVLAVALAFRC